MLPLLQSFKNDEIKTSNQIRNDMINHFSITDEEQKEKHPSGNYIYYNRVGWAISCLKSAELLSSPEHGSYQITSNGKSILYDPPEKITISFLNQFKNFSKNKNPIKNTIDEKEIPITDKTPDELIEIGFNQIKNELSLQLLKKIRDGSSYFFEKLVLDLLIKMGYGAYDVKNSKVTPKGSDEGIDGIIKEDKLGLDKIYIQAKKWKDTVGSPEIQKFIGALEGQKAKKGVFITTSQFSKDAFKCIKNVNAAVVLIDGEKLAEYMIENELGVTLKQNYRIYNIDSDYFKDD